MSFVRNPTQVEAAIVCQQAQKIIEILEYSSKFHVIKWNLRKDHELMEYCRKYWELTKETISFPKQCSPSTVISPLLYFTHDSQHVIPSIVNYFLNKTISSSSYALDLKEQQAFESEISQALNTLERIIERTKANFLDASVGPEKVSEVKTCVPATMTQAEIITSIHTLRELLQLSESKSALKTNQLYKIFNAKMYFDDTDVEARFEFKKIKKILLEYCQLRRESKEVTTGINHVKSLQEKYEKRVTPVPQLLENIVNIIKTRINFEIAAIQQSCQTFCVSYSSGMHPGQSKERVMKKILLSRALEDKAYEMTRENLQEFQNEVERQITHFVQTYDGGMFHSKPFTSEDFAKLSPSYQYATHLKKMWAKSMLLTTRTNEIFKSITAVVSQRMSLDDFSLQIKQSLEDHKDQLFYSDSELHLLSRNCHFISVLNSIDDTLKMIRQVETLGRQSTTSKEEKPLCNLTYFAKEHKSASGKTFSLCRSLAPQR